ncbi:glycosyltransferase [Flavobacterium sp. 3HN19-14]|uniref:glycosyltransferase n=1 Tax=Flavobacterium sp. 3HN19-14 TaxID=3448133 RepID=UPI003EDFDC97
MVRTKPEVLFLIIGKTHPTLVKEQGESYRNMLETMVESLGLQDNVMFINKYVELNELLEYLQLTDIYLFTSKDPNQAVSGTFSYAMSCGCPIISTPIPHAKEVLDGDTGILFDFDNSDQLAAAVNLLLFDVKRKKEIILNGLHKITPTSWENAAVAHAKLFEELMKNSETESRFTLQESGNQSRAFQENDNRLRDVPVCENQSA